MILLYFSSSLHVTDDIVLPIGDGPSGQQTNLLDQSPMGPCEGHQVSVPPISSHVRSAPKTPQGPSGQQTKLLEQSPMGPFEGHPISVPTISGASGDSLSNLGPLNLSTPEKSCRDNLDVVPEAATPYTPQPIPTGTSTVKRTFGTGILSPAVKRRLVNSDSPLKSSDEMSPGVIL